MGEGWRAGEGWVYTTSCVVDAVLTPSPRGSADTFPQRVVPFGLLFLFARRDMNCKLSNYLMKIHAGASQVQPAFWYEPLPQRTTTPHLEASCCYTNYEHTNRAERAVDNLLYGVLRGNSAGLGQPWQTHSTVWIQSRLLGVLSREAKTLPMPAGPVLPVAPPKPFKPLGRCKRASRTWQSHTTLSEALGGRDMRNAP